MSTPLTIGDFSRITHLSVKTLRHYHRVGLLEPSAVNPGSGYRYYTEDQVPAAQVIVRLRDLDMPVAEVKAVLAAPDASRRNELIAAHLNRLEADLARTRAAVGSLRNLLGRADILLWWQGALGELRAAARAQRVRPAGPAGGLYASEIFTDEHGEALVFIPIAGNVRPIGRITQVTVPAAELAVVTHAGSLEDVDVT